MLPKSTGAGGATRPGVPCPGRSRTHGSAAGDDSEAGYGMQASTPYLRWARVGVATLLLGVQLDGCASGGATQSMAPSDETERQPLDELHLTSLEPGTQVRIILRGDSLVSGKFRSVSRMEPAAYAARVAAFRAARTDAAPLPAPGSAIRVRRGSRDRPAFLDGYGYRTLELRWKKSSSPEILAFDDIRAVTDSSGHVWTRDALDIEVIRGRVPCYTMIEVETENGRAQVPVDQVTNVMYRTSSGRWVLAALVVVTMVVVLVVAAVRSSKPTGPQCQGSTPTLTLRDPAMRAALARKLGVSGVNR